MVDATDFVAGGRLAGGQSGGGAGSMGDQAAAVAQEALVQQSARVFVALVAALQVMEGGVDEPVLVVGSARRTLRGMRRRASRSSR